ncbi:MAG TPA: hypothetical protein VNF45_04825 [Candidatus Binataceae bacterium]|nr:hypothetical protein [Candidatus Binataceae bacterium]
MKKRNKKQHKQKRIPPPPRPNGFDFGIDQMAMAISDYQFSNLFHDAKVSACVYGIGYSPEVGTNVPFISLAASNIDPLRAAFEILHRWDRAPGDDGLSLEFILRRDGGYLIAISPDFRAMLSRVNKSDRFFTQFGVNVSWIKDFPARGPWLADFRKYLAQRAAPFVFTGCQWVAADQPPRHVPGLPEILKFEAHFSDEGSTTPGSFGHAMLDLHNQGKSKGKHSALEKPTQPIEAIRERRADQLKRHFPVTLSRSRTELAFEGFQSRNSNLGMQRWQWEQAFCNAVVSIEMTGGAHYPGLGERELVAAIAQQLLGRIELAGMPAPTRVDDEVLIAQILLDGRYLLKNRGCANLAKGPEELQDQLVQQGLL